MNWGADGVPQQDYALAEASLFDQFQIQPHTIREEAFSAADDRGAVTMQLTIHTTPN